MNVDVNNLDPVENSKIPEIIKFLKLVEFLIFWSKIKTALSFRVSCFEKLIF